MRTERNEVAAEQPNNIISISANYYCCTTADVELPEGVVWEDIKEWYVKWDSFHFRTESADWREIPMFSDTSNEIVDWKRPTQVDVLKYNHEDECPYFDEPPLASIGGNHS